MVRPITLALSMTATGVCMRILARIQIQIQSRHQCKCALRESTIGKVHLHIVVAGMVASMMFVTRRSTRTRQLNIATRKLRSMKMTLPLPEAATMVRPITPALTMTAIGACSRILDLQFQSDPCALTVRATLVGRGILFLD